MYVHTRDAGRREIPLQGFDDSMLQADDECRSAFLVQG